MKKAIGMFLLMPGSFILISVVVSFATRSTGVDPSVLLAGLTVLGIGLLVSK